MEFVKLLDWGVSVRAGAGVVRELTLCEGCLEDVLDLVGNVYPNGEERVRTQA